MTENFLNAFNTEHTRLLFSPDNKDYIENWLLTFWTEANLYRITNPEEVSRLVSSVFSSVPVRSFIMNVTTNLSYYYSNQDDNLNLVAIKLSKMINNSGLLDDDFYNESVVPNGIKQELNNLDVLPFLKSNQWFSTLILIALHLDKTNFYTILYTSEK